MDLLWTFLVSVTLTGLKQRAWIMVCEWDQVLYLNFFVYLLNLLDLCVYCQGGLPIANVGGVYAFS